MPKPSALPRILAMQEPEPIHGKTTDKQALFVDYYSRGGINGKEAAALAGYANPGQEAWRLLSLPHVRAQLRAHRESVINGDLAKLALATLEDLMQRPETPAAVKLGSARTALEMARHLGVAAPKDAALHDRPLSELSHAELQRLVEEGTGVLAALAKNVTPDVTPGDSPGTL